MSHSGHEIVKCSQCGRIIRQCRCADKNKIVRFENCGCNDGGIPSARVIEFHSEVFVCPSCQFETKLEYRGVKVAECGHCGISVQLSRAKWAGNNKEIAEIERLQAELDEARAHRLNP